MTTQAQATVQIDNEHFRVTEWRFQPEAETGWHRHEFEYVVVPMTTGPLKLQLADGESVNELTAGESYTRPAGSEHNVINPGPEEFVFIEIEFKKQSRD
jgi:beta-alanine degradation protein BauB